MKKILFAIAFCLIGSLSYAQTVISTDFAGQVGTTRTLANATADTINLQITKARPTLTFKYDITKNSGTVGGTIVLQGRATTADSWSVVNSYTLTDATATNSVLLTNNAYVYYRIITAPTGTQNSTHSKYVVARQY